ncbi:MAG: hypothetical protein ACTSXJ_04150 [Candidatus Baldrarchaeia archaeon]
MSDEGKIDPLLIRFMIELFDAISEGMVSRVVYLGAFIDEILGLAEKLRSDGVLGDLEKTNFKRTCDFLREMWSVRYAFFIRIAFSICILLIGASVLLFLGLTTISDCAFLLLLTLPIAITFLWIQCNGYSKRLLQEYEDVVSPPVFVKQTAKEVVQDLIGLCKNMGLPKAIGILRLFNGEYEGIRIIKKVNDEILCEIS